MDKLNDAKFDDYEEEELEPPRPYTPEQREAIDEINAEIAKAFAEFCKMGGVYNCGREN